MRVTQKQADTFNHAIDEILAACYNLGLTKVKTSPKIKAGQRFTEEQAWHFKQIEDYAHSDLASVANDLFHEAKETPNGPTTEDGFTKRQIVAHHHNKQD